MLCSGVALAAQLPRLPSTVEPGREPPPSIDVPEGQFDFSIAAPRKTALPSDVETLRFVVKKISIEGTTVFKHGDLMPLVDPLIGTEASLADIMRLAQALEARYREEGYLLTRAIVPPQHTKDGEFRIQVIEAFINAIVVDGVEGGLKDSIAEILAPVLQERPLTAATMERGLLLVNDLPGIHAVGLLKPAADEVGGADLQITVSQQRLSASASADNRASRYSGPVIANVNVAVNSLAISGDQLGAGVTRSIDPHKQRGYRVHYSVPIGADGLVATTTLERNLGQPGYTLAPLDITTDSIAIGERLSYPLVRSRSFNLFVDGGFTWKTARTDILGQAATFDQTSVADVKLSASQSGWLDGVTAGSLGLAKGLSVLAASRPGAANLSRPNADPQFTKLEFDVRRVQPVTPELSLVLTGVGQRAFSSLLAGDQFALGGYQYGRGFDPAALTGDSGVGGSAELHYDIPVPLIDRLQTYGFYDYGWVWDHQSTKSSSLSSVGFGIRAPITSYVDITAEAAHRLHGPAPTVMPDEAARVLFSLQARWW
jgi:hemolysin activation/secretion protein